MRIINLKQISKEKQDRRKRRSKGRGGRIFLTI